ncbi:hypothetical protein C8Q74DRAFT_677364 [Fomes fomentarius]|nr:hypothetical protein C8Q74DRAFT_677364 [Fomes fomentarius]
MGNGTTNFYAPKPQTVSLYPIPPGGAVQDSPFRPPGSSPNSFVSNIYKKENNNGINYREVTRTPSPTPSETVALSGKTRTFNFKKYFDPEFWKDRRNVISFIVTITITALVITFIAMQDKIVDAISPAAQWLRETPGAWLIPIAIMIVLSFPPLVGHEVVALLCGDVWGLGIGFGIVTAGTIIGELITYYTFRVACRGRAQKAEDKNLRYAFLSAVIQEGGFKMAVMMRYSAIPGHITTAIFAAAGMNVLTFLIAAVVALPKQLVTVYLGSAGYSNAPADEDGNKTVSKGTRILKIGIIVFTIIVTMFAMHYVNGQIDKVKGRVIYERRKRRQAKLAPFSASASGAALADIEESDSTPLVVNGGGDSMDHAAVEAGHNPHLSTL